MDIIDLFFIVLTGIIAYRLYTALGQRDEGQQPPRPSKNFSEEWRKRSAPSTQEEKKESPLITTLKQIQHVDKTFTQERFLQGAEKAFELIIISFIKGDKERLKYLVSSALLKKFSKTIDQRQKEETTAELAFFRVTRTEIKSMEIKNNITLIEVNFGSEQTQLLKNKEGKILEGDPDHIDQIEEIWTFERPLSSKEPTWVLTETASAA